MAAADKPISEQEQEAGGWHWGTKRGQKEWGWGDDGFAKVVWEGNERGASGPVGVGVARDCLGLLPSHSGEEEGGEAVRKSS